MGSLRFCVRIDERCCKKNILDIILMESLRYNHMNSVRH